MEAINEVYKQLKKDIETNKKGRERAIKIFMQNFSGFVLAEVEIETRYFINQLEEYDKRQELLYSQLEFLKYLKEKEEDIEKC